MFLHLNLLASDKRFLLKISLFILVILLYKLIVYELTSHVV